MRKEFYGPYIRIILDRKLKIDLGKLSKVFVPGVSFILKRKYRERLREMGIKKNISFFEKSPDLVIFSSLIYFISSIKEGNKVDKEKLERGKKLLDRVYPVKGDNWEDVSIDYANAYIAFFMQKL